MIDKKYIDTLKNKYIKVSKIVGNNNYMNYFQGTVLEIGEYDFLLDEAKLGKIRLSYAESTIMYIIGD
jgi:hypothetical protein